MTQQHDAAHQDTSQNRHARTTSPLKGLGTLIAAIVVVGAFIALSGTLGITDMWVGFLFALYWAALMRSDFKQFPACVLGAAVGITYAYLLRELPSVVGASGITICIVIVIVMVYFQIMGWLSVIINSATMLFMLVSTIPPVIASSQYPRLLIALSFGAAYFGIVVWIARQVAQRRASGPNLAKPSST